jgi:hypothetical protein
MMIPLGLRADYARVVFTYPGGVTLRTRRRILIVRWKGYVPETLDGWRRRYGRVEIHCRALLAFPVLVERKDRT